MAPQIATYLSVLSILFLDPLKGQTGRGCYFTTCSEPGQIRMDAIFDASGFYKGGCNCACDARLYDEKSPQYCDQPRSVNFNANTLSGDCSCKCPEPFEICRFPHIFDPIECECVCPQYTTQGPSCNTPHLWRQDLCECACAIGSVGGPCVVAGEFIANSKILSDCTCDTNANAVITTYGCSGMKVMDPISGECKCPLTHMQCNYPQIFNAETCECGCNSIVSLNPCIAPRVWREDLCLCACAIGSIGGPCISNGEFIIDTRVLSDCTCGCPTCPPSFVQDPYTCQCNNPNTANNPVTVCYMKGDPCSANQHCCSTVCKIDGICY